MGNPNKLSVMNITIVTGSGGKKLAYANGAAPANGDVRAAKYQPPYTLVWECATPFTLEIQDYTRYPNPATEYPAAFERAHHQDSPFAGGPSYPSSPGGQLGNQLSQPVAPGAKSGVYKYGLIVKDPPGPDVRDDPQIIID